MLFKIVQNCVASNSRKLLRYLKQALKSVFNLSNLLKIENDLPLTKQIGNIKCSVILDLSRFRQFSFAKSGRLLSTLFLENPLFKIAFLNDQSTLEISPSHFWL